MNCYLNRWVYATEWLCRWHDQNIGFRHENLTFMRIQLFIGFEILFGHRSIESRFKIEITKWIDWMWAGKIVFSIEYTTNRQQTETINSVSFFSPFSSDAMCVCVCVSCEKSLSFWDERMCGVSRGLLCTIRKMENTISIQNLSIFTNISNVCSLYTHTNFYETKERKKTWHSM